MNGAQHARCRYTIGMSFLAVLIFAIPTALVHPAEFADVAVVRVEEDWELVVGQPDADSSGPQVVSALFPTGQYTPVHAVFELNHRSLPSFQPGGLQLQTWAGETLVAAHQHPQGALLSTAGETVRWTQMMELNEGSLTFEIVGGESTTWGSFGSQGYLKERFNTNIEDLNGYNPADSVKHSGVSYAANRVQSLVLKRVRYYLDDGQLYEDETDRVVYSAASP